MREAGLAGRVALLAPPVPRQPPEQRVHPYVQAHLRVGGPGDRVFPVVPRRAEAAGSPAVPDADADGDQLGPIQDRRLYLHVRSERRQPDDGETDQGPLPVHRNRVRGRQLRRRDGAGAPARLALDRLRRGGRRGSAVPGAGEAAPGRQGARRAAGRRGLSQGQRHPVQAEPAPLHRVPQDRPARLRRLLRTARSVGSPALTEMKKGVSPQQNLQTLKWSLYYDIHLAWNILLGFPGETNEDYRRQVDLILSILHFQPPEAVGEIWIERFSPYWKWPEQNGIRITGPGLAYEYVYDPRKVDLNEIAYDFEYELVEKRVDPSLMEELTRLTHEWQRLHATDDKPFLYYSKAMDFVTVFDGRAPDKPVKQRYDWPHAFIIEFCNDAPKYFGQIRGELNDRAGGAGYDEATIKQALNELLQKRVLYEEKGRYFTLALPVNRTF